MLHRVSKKDDVHRGKWNGLGGKFDPGETPEECVGREVFEESGLRIRDPQLKGILTFPKFSRNVDWYVCVFIATEFSGTLIESPEGKLAWVEDAQISNLNLWEGDRIFLEWLKGDRFFSGKFAYECGTLVHHEVTFY